VSFLYGPGRVFAQVTEDRGPLGVNRQRLYRIRLDQADSEPRDFEMPEDELEAAAKPDKTAVLRYLTQGGLVKILQSNLGGGKNPPRVWLTFTRRGNVTHTFSPERGLVGGAAVPFFALHEDKVFLGKREAVVQFLTSFGLSRAEAEDVVGAVGTAP
jgi:hypothetical protein